MADNGVTEIGDLPQTLADLPGPQALFCLEVGSFLDELIPQARHRTYVVAFSGGGDSTALALILYCLGCRVVLAHLDHALRAESQAEAVSAARFAESLGVPFFGRRQEVAELAAEQGLGIEEAGRTARYAFLEEVRRESGADWIALGHQLDDLSEDVLLRLVRGTGWPGLGGMQAVDISRKLVRPLLCVRKEKILGFLRALGVNWLEDASNAGDICRRNRMRNHVLPLLCAENPAFPDVIRSLWKLAREDECYWEDRMAPVLAQVQETDRGLRLPRQVYVNQPRALRLRVAAALLRQAGKGQARATTLFALDSACMASKAAKEFQFPGGIVLRTDAEGLLLLAGSKKLILCQLNGKQQFKGEFV